MGIKYLRNRPWSDWTRDERFFCSILYNHASRDAAGFASWLIGEADLQLLNSGQWDLGYEVCFYRDFLWQTGSTATAFDVPDQRTFDLCLFGEQSIIIIEAKVYEAFGSAQNSDFGLDKKRIASLPGLEALEVRVVALASSRYFANQAKYGRDDTLSVFDGCVTWSKIAERYPDKLLGQANRTYKIKPGESIE
jgi:hypothetical protein